jgi:alkyldihydroxyacetonephosphate synthase
MGVLSETFESAITWERFEHFHSSVLTKTTAAVHEVCGRGFVICRFTHVYPDGPAPYYTILAPVSRDGGHSRSGPR